MPREGDDAQVTVRYWAAAREAAGRDSEVATGCATVGAVVDQVTARHPALARVAAVSSLLLDGRSTTRAAAVGDGAVVEVLPPFAGG